MSVGTYQEETPIMYNQGLFEESSTAKQRLGLVRELDDGRKFAYAHAGEGLAAGVNTAAEVGTGLWVASGVLLTMAVAANAAIGDRRVQITLGATAVVVADYFKDGWFYPDTTPGQGHLYKIRGHAAIGTGATGWIELYDALRVALTSAATKVSCIPNKQRNVIAAPVSSSPTGPYTGVPPIAVTTGYYFWNQVKGECAGMLDTAVTHVEGSHVMPSPNHAGQFVIETEALYYPRLGVVIGINADNLMGLINLHIPGY